MHKQFEPIFYETFCQVRKSAIVIYDQPTKQLSYKRKELTVKTYSGNVTSHSARRIRKATDLLVQIAKEQTVWNPVISRFTQHTLSFITLTISAKEQHLTAKEGHKLLLEKWLLRMKRKANMTTYIWKAELQKNGQLHYHITTPSWINYTLIRDEWNNLLHKNNMATSWPSDTGKVQNSTDIHAVYKVKDMAAYLCKYLSKSEKEKSTTGKIWDCSLNLKSTKFFTVQMPLDFQITDKDIKVKDCDRCTMLFTTLPILNFSTQIQRQYSIYLDAVRSFRRDKKVLSLAAQIAISGGIRNKIPAHWEDYTLRLSDKSAAPPPILPKVSLNPPWVQSELFHQV